jgi:hemerythrin
MDPGEETTAMALRWDASFSIGIACVDDRHRELFRKVQELLEAVRQRRDGPELLALLDSLGRDAVGHFAEEEELMREARYPGLGPHRSDHLDFARDFQSLRADLEAGGLSPAIAVRINVWLCGWLRRHAADADRDLGRFLEARIGAPAPAPAAGQMGISASPSR